MPSLRAWAETADVVRMARMPLVVAIVAIAAMKIVSLTDASSAATATRGQTLFGMNVPSLERLDDSESAVGVRAAIVGTFADWVHAPDFPHALARDVNRRGAVLLVSWEPWDSERGGAEHQGVRAHRRGGSTSDRRGTRGAH